MLLSFLTATITPMDSAITALTTSDKSDSSIVAWKRSITRDKAFWPFHLMDCPKSPGKCCPGTLHTEYTTVYPAPSAPLPGQSPYPDKILIRSLRGQHHGYRVAGNTSQRNITMLTANNASIEWNTRTRMKRCISQTCSGVISDRLRNWRMASRFGRKPNRQYNYQFQQYNRSPITLSIALKYFRKILS
jgi:hypothetical protein